MLAEAEGKIVKNFGFGQVLRLWANTSALGKYFSLRYTTSLVVSLTIKLIVETLTRQKRVGSTRSIAVGIRDKMAVGFSQITKKRASSFSFLGWER